MESMKQKLHDRPFNKERMQELSLIFAQSQKEEDFNGELLKELECMAWKVIWKYHGALIHDNFKPDVCQHVLLTVWNRWKDGNTIHRKMIDENLQNVSYWYWSNIRSIISKLLPYMKGQKRLNKWDKDPLLVTNQYDLLNPNVSKIGEFTRKSDEGPTGDEAEGPGGNEFHEEAWRDPFTSEGEEIIYTEMEMKRKEVQEKFTPGQIVEYMVKQNPTSALARIHKALGSADLTANLMLEFCNEGDRTLHLPSVSKVNNAVMTMTVLDEMGTANDKDAKAKELAEVFRTTAGQINNIYRSKQYVRK